MRVDNAVLAVLSVAATEGNQLFLTGQLDRKIYEKTNKVLEAAGGKWNRKAKAHVFDSDAADRIDQIIVSGEVEIPKDEFNYFPTPPDVVDRLMAIAGIEPHMQCLEPSAGRGAIAVEMHKAGAFVHMFELMAANHQALVELGIPGAIATKADFLLASPNPVYDRVVMNPPFAKQADIKHVMHALKFMRPDGLLVSVMSAGVTFRDNRLTKDFRDLVRSRGGEIEALPDGAFKASGTMVNTVVVTIPGVDF